MPIRLEWIDQEKTLIYAEVVERAEHEDFLAASRQFRAMLDDAAPRPVDVICDMRGQVVFTPGMFRTARELHGVQYQNLRYTVFLGRNLAWQVFRIFIRRFGGVSYRFMLVETLEDAHDVIRRVRQDAALNPPPPSAGWN